jgi:arylformamidase
MNCLPPAAGKLKTGGKMTLIYDISLTITPGLIVWPGDPSVELERVNKIEDGANANVSRVAMSVHTGTHVDAPYHFLQGGTTIEALPMDALVGPVVVFELADSVDTITANELSELNWTDHPERILFKTRNSHYWAQKLDKFQTKFVGISKDGAEFLVAHGVKLVGIDYLSIAPYKQSRPTHEVLLAARMVCLEGVNLEEVPAGEYTLVCLPLKLGGSDGAPARVILIDNLG